MTTLFAPVKMIVAFIVALLAPTYVGISASLFEIDAQGVTIPLYQTITVTNKGPERARFTVSGNLPWMSVGREYIPTATTVQLAPGDAVDFIVEVHPALISGDSAHATITVTAADPRDGSTLDAQTIGVRVVKHAPASPPASPAVTSPRVVSPAVPALQSPSPEPLPSLPLRSRLTPAISRAPAPSLEPQRPTAPQQSAWRSFIDFLVRLFD